MKEITSTAHAWVTAHSRLTPEEINDPASIEHMVFSGYDMKSAGWTHVGEATITVSVILSPAQLIVSRIDTLKAQQAKIRVEAQERLDEIDSMVKNLLAITYTPTEPLSE